MHILSSARRLAIKAGPLRNLYIYIFRIGFESILNLFCRIGFDLKLRLDGIQSLWGKMIVQ